ncbi:MAG TPA: hypothetical protein VEO54_31825 [Thermoanaerobaculia bacterium]|nr:hypothetical protein [Thermoanaerobaculia bacterium]
MIVIDASALIDELHSPVTGDAEVLHGIRRALFRGVITDIQAEYVVAFLRDAPLERHAVEPLVPAT